MAYGVVGDDLPKSTVDKICSTDYMPIRCLRRSHSLDINVDPGALGEDKTNRRWFRSPRLTSGWNCS